MHSGGIEVRPLIAQKLIDTAKHVPSEIQCAHSFEGRRVLQPGHLDARQVKKIHLIKSSSGDSHMNFLAGVRDTGPTLTSTITGNASWVSFVNVALSVAFRSKAEGN